jgi:hypothetical protein
MTTMHDSASPVEWLIEFMANTSATALARHLVIKHGAVIWLGELDSALDAMHSAIREHGEWVL